MGLATVTAGTLAGITAVSVYSLRRVVSRNWIDYRNRGPTDLGKKVIVVTGGNCGLGYESAKEFARRNAAVVLACRDVVKGGAAAEEIRRATGNVSVECMEIDLGSLDSVGSFASELRERHPGGIHALVCNAGVWVPMEKGRKTTDGYEVHFGVNHLGHFVLARTVAERMAQSKKACRLVWVSSGLLCGGKIDFDKRDFIQKGRNSAFSSEDGQSGGDKKEKKKGFAPPTGYADSKLMNALTCRHLATMLVESSPHVTTYAVSPGFCRSSLGRHVAFPLHKRLMLTPIMGLIQRTSLQGAQNIVHATLENRDSLQSGSLYRDGEIAQKETDYINSIGDDAPKKLWNLSKDLVDGK